MEDAPADEKWIQRRVWLRWARLFYGIFFIWAAGLALNFGSWRWALWPFLSFAAFLIFGSWLRRIEPKIGRTLSFFLGLLLLAHNVIGTLWPFFVRNFPHIAQGLVRVQGRTDIVIGVSLACDTALQQSLGDYALASQDAEAANLKKEFGALNDARLTGRFSAADEAHERELLQRYRQLIQRSANLRKMLSESGCTVGGSPPMPLPKTQSVFGGNDSDLSSPQGSLPVPPTAIAKSVPRKVSEENFERAVAPAIDRRRERLDEFRSLLNANINLVSTKRNIGLMIQGPPTTGNFSPVQSLYGQIRSSDANLISDLFRREVLSLGYFDDLYRGDPEMLKLATTTMRLDALILGRLSFTFRKDSAVDGELISCDMGLSYRVVNQSAAIVKSDSFQVVGPGFSESTALERGVQILANQFSEKLSKTF